MLASYRWLKELSGIDASPEEYAEKLTAAGLEVDGLERFEAPSGVVVAEVLSIRPHPSKDKLRLVTVNHGEGEQEVVCGAPNVPEPGGRVLLAKLGAVLPPAQEGGEPFVIAERPIGGVPSAGMLCSERELKLCAEGEGEDGIYVFADGHRPDNGTPLGEALPVDDVVFEIGLTPNRPDCLGHVGIARDLRALFSEAAAEKGVAASGGGSVPARPPAYAEGATGLSDANLQLPFEGGREVALDSSLASLRVDVQDGSRCPRYGAAIVDGVTVGPSPFWLRYRLHCLGLRSISNLVDATNWIMLEWGHPIHGFDRAKLRGDALVIRRASEGETITTLDEVERTLVADDLLICDAEGPVAIAGVMGAANSELETSTTAVAIECAYFEPRGVRRTSRRLGLHTDASHRFERGVDPNAVPQVLARAAALIAEVGGGIAMRDAADRYPKAIERVAITLRHGSLEGLLGVSVPADVPARVLTALGCEVSTAGEGAERSYAVRAPTHRPDLGREADLIEEVARIWGYEHVEAVVPKVRASRTGTPERLRFERRLREAACLAGLHEAVTYSFVSEQDLAGAGAPAAEVRLDNPLSEERSVMRTSLLPGLAAAAVHALRRQAPEVNLFELGRTFFQGDDLPSERLTFGLIVAGRPREGLGRRDANFYDLKGALERALAGAELGALRFTLADAPPAFL
ncbi:MAG: phenylalanine--tRNA ligase subunit beta, partial [Myxococcota bacterium]